MHVCAFCSCSKAFSAWYCQQGLHVRSAWLYGWTHTSAAIQILDIHPEMEQTPTFEGHLVSKAIGSIRCASLASAPHLG